MKAHRNRENGDRKIKLPPLKQWTKETLTRRDWDFTAFCDALKLAAPQLSELESLGLIHRAFIWEIDRELGSGNGPFDLEKELARPSLRQSDPRERQILLQRDDGATDAVAIEPPLWLLKQPRMNPLKSQEVCIRGISAFVEKLRQQSSPLTRFLMGEFSEATRKRILAIPPPQMGRSSGGDEVIRLSGPLQAEINRIIRKGSIYTKDRFKGVSLSAETKSLLDSEPTGEELIRLNRLLLEDAFPLDIPKGSRQLRPLNEWHLGELRDYLASDTFSASRASNDICALEIPWTEDEDEVVEAFRLWLQEHRGRHVGQAGRKHEWRTWFKKLAIYRLSVAGHTRPETLSRLKEFLRKFHYKPSSPANFIHDKEFISEEIERRFKTLVHSAKEFGERVSGRNDWRGHFLKQ